MILPKENEIKEIIKRREKTRNIKFLYDKKQEYSLLNVR